MNGNSGVNAYLQPDFSTVADGEAALRERIQQKPFWALLLFPFLLIRRGHINLLLYIALLVTTGFFACAEIVTLLDTNFSALVKSGDLSEGIAHALLLISTAAIVFILYLPVLIVMVTSPVEQEWLYGKLKLPELLGQTPRAIIIALRTLVLSTRDCFYYFIPVAALALGYSYLLRKDVVSGTPAIFHVIAVIVFLGVMSQILPMLFAPIIAVCGHYNAIGAIQVSRPIVQSRAAALGCIAALCIAVAFGGWYLFSLIEIPAEFQYQVYVGSASFLLWYFLTVVAHTIMLQTSIFAYQQVRASIR